VLSTDQLRVQYGTTEAVRQVDIVVEQGEVIALLGPNGAGKTSILRAMTGLVPFDGDVRFDGETVRKVLPNQIARRGLIHVPEGRHVFPTLTVHENLQMGRVASFKRTPAYGMDEVYDLFPALQHLKTRPGYALSGGEQQMVAIGRALLSAPKLLLLDEPSLGLAPLVVQAVFDALSEIRKVTPVLVVEQNTALALGLCDRAYVLAEGKIVMQGTPDQLGGREQLLASYLGQADVLVEEEALGVDPYA